MILDATRLILTHPPTLYKKSNISKTKTILFRWMKKIFFLKKMSIFLKFFVVMTKKVSVLEEDEEDSEENEADEE